jgi:hypothetical protein
MIFDGPDLRPIRHLICAQGGAFREFTEGGWHEEEEKGQRQEILILRSRKMKSLRLEGGSR